MSDREERKRRETQKKRDNAKVYCIYKENEYTKRNTKTEEISTEEILSPIRKTHTKINSNNRQSFSEQQPFLVDLKRTL